VSVNNNQGDYLILFPYYTCRLGELVVWHLMDKRGVKADPWEGEGLGFNSGWWGIDTMMCR
jgi:hypothetical protein